MTKCPQCKGVGKVKVTVRGVGEPEEIMNLPCPTCGGAGHVTPIGAAAYQRSKEIWCMCERSPGTYYVPDNVHAEITKHHWRCEACHQVTQIG